MNDETTPDLSLLLRQQRQLLSDLGSMRDDFTVLTAIAMRLDGAMSTLPMELRAMHSQHSRLANRVRVLESAADGDSAP